MREWYWVNGLVLLVIIAIVFVSFIVVDTILLELCGSTLEPVYYRMHCYLYGGLLTLSMTGLLLTLTLIKQYMEQRGVEK